MQAWLHFDLAICHRETALGEADVFPLVHKCMNALSLLPLDARRAMLAELHPLLTAMSQAC